MRKITEPTCSMYLVSHRKKGNARRRVHSQISTAVYCKLKREIAMYGKRKKKDPGVVASDSLVERLSTFQQTLSPFPASRKRAG